MDSFLSKKASSFLSSKTDDSKPENKNEKEKETETEKPHTQPSEKPHTQPSNFDLLSSAQLVAEAAKSSIGGESDKVDTGKVAGAGADLLGAASDYGNLEDKSFGKYVGQAEDYLDKYHTSHSTTTTTTGSGESATETEIKTETETTKTTDSGKSATEPPVKTGGSESGYGDYAKMAGGFLKKH